ISPRPLAQRRARARSSSSAGSGGSSDRGSNARASSVPSHPSAATLYVPGRSLPTASRSAATRSSTWTTCTGGLAPRTRLGGVHGGREARVGPEGGILRQGHRVVGPRAVDGGSRHADHLAHTDGGGRV